MRQVGYYQERFGYIENPRGSLLKKIAAITVAMLKTAVARIPPLTSQQCRKSRIEFANETCNMFSLPVLINVAQ